MIRRYMKPLIAAVALFAAVSAGQASAQRDSFEISGTIIAAQGSILTILTDDVSGREQPIMVDVSYLRNLQYKVGDPIALWIRAREYDTFVALGVTAESPYVNGEDFGVREEFATRQDSIQARVGNVPEDDEALAQNGFDDDDDDDDEEEDEDEKEDEDDD